MQVESSLTVHDLIQMRPFGAATKHVADAELELINRRSNKAATQLAGFLGDLNGLSVLGRTVKCVSLENGVLTWEVRDTADFCDACQGDPIFENGHGVEIECPKCDGMTSESVDDEGEALMTFLTDADVTRIIEDEPDASQYLDQITGIKAPWN